MNKSIQEVAEFHHTFNHPIAKKPMIPDMATVLFRINFIKEELDELLKAAQEGNLVEVADGLGDIQYVLDGFYLNAGLHTIKDAISSEIHRSNMSKACRDEAHALETIEALRAQGVECYEEQVGNYWVVKRTEDGKVQKATGYSPPILASIIEELVFPDGEKTWNESRFVHIKDVDPQLNGETNYPEWEAAVKRVMAADFFSHHHINIHDWEFARKEYFDNAVSAKEAHCQHYYE